MRRTCKFSVELVVSWLAAGWVVAFVLFLLLAIRSMGR